MTTDDQLKIISRKLESIENTQKIQFQDRNILEDILLKIDKQADNTAHLQEEIKLLKQRIENLEKISRAENKDILQEVQKVGDKVEDIASD